MRPGRAISSSASALAVCTAGIAAAMATAGTTFAGDAGPAGPAGRDLFGTRDKAKRASAQDAPVPATVEWSDGRKETGRLSFTPGVPLAVYDLGKKEWVDIELADLEALEASPRAEKMDREWRWKDYGSDEKVYTGRERPRRWLDHTLRLKGSEAMKVHVKGTVMYFDTAPDTAKQEPGVKSAGIAAGKTDDKPDKVAAPKPVRRRLIIRQYDRGDWGQTLEGLVYVKRIEVGEPKGAPAEAPRPAGKRPGVE